MKIDVEDILCKAEAISLQMTQCKVYSAANNCNIFLPLFISKERFSYKASKWQSAFEGRHKAFFLFTIISLPHLIENSWLIMPDWKHLIGKMAKVMKIFLQLEAVDFKWQYIIQLNECRTGSLIIYAASSTKGRVSPAACGWQCILLHCYQALVSKNKDKFSVLSEFKPL